MGVPRGHFDRLSSNGFDSSDETTPVRAELVEALPRKRNMDRLIAIDWGTSSLRGARLDAQGVALDERASPQGILNVPPGGFESVFQATFGDWLGSPDTLCLISGMAGSTNMASRRPSMSSASRQR